MNAKQLEQFKLNYAELIVEGMDMDSLSEILDYYDEETLMDLMPEESQTK